MEVEAYAAPRVREEGHSCQLQALERPPLLTVAGLHEFNAGIKFNPGINLRIPVRSWLSLSPEKCVSQELQMHSLRLCPLRGSPQSSRATLQCQPWPVVRSIVDQAQFSPQAVMWGTRRQTLGALGSTGSYRASGQDKLHLHLMSSLTHQFCLEVKNATLAVGSSGRGLTQHPMFGCSVSSRAQS